MSVRRQIRTPNSSAAAIKAGKHVLCEKPIARDAAEAFKLARLAQAAGVKTKVGFTFRYSPALRQIRAWIADGTLGQIFHIHGLEQNSQFLDPYFPLRQVPAGSNWLASIRCRNPSWAMDRTSSI